jgi:hypothetical protein
MPQETKSFPQNPEEMEHAPGTVHEKLEGWIPALATPEDLRLALEKAFDYRGDVTITKKDGSVVEGYIFDRRSGQSLSDSMVRLFPRDQNEKIAIRYDEIAALNFSGKDPAAGKSWETWLKKYQEKKAAGEKNIGIEPEKLD